MGRTILGVVVGFLVMFILILVIFACAYLAMGADGAFQLGSYNVSTTWLVLSFVVGFSAAVAGGCVCVSIAKSKKAGMGLAVAALVFGIVIAIPVLMAPDDPAGNVRPGDVPFMETMMKARQPTWAALLTPLIGVLGVVLGASICGKKFSAQS